MSSKNSGGKNIANALCNASTITVLAVGFAPIGKQLRGGMVPRRNLSEKDFLMTTLDISGAVVTKNWLISQGMLPPTIIN